MVILGVSGTKGTFHDSSATLVVDGRIVAYVEEERFNRWKHSDGLPFNAIAYCLKKGGISASDIDHVGFFVEPEVLVQRMYGDIQRMYGKLPRTIEYIVKAASNSFRMEEGLREKFEFGANTKFTYLNHHLTHASSAYHISGLERSAVLTIDGFGDRESCALFVANTQCLKKVQDFLVFPESLGMLYNSMAAHLGLGWGSGPGKLMGLAGFGRPDPALFADLITLTDDPARPVKIDPSVFDYFLLARTWSADKQNIESGVRPDSAPRRTPPPIRRTSAFSESVVRRFGEERKSGEELTQHHCDLAASTQMVLETAIMHMVRQIPILLPEEKNLCLAGGVALNVITNRRILDSGIFERLFVTPPANDGGTSLGSALYLDWLHSGRWKHEFDVYAGPDIEEDFDIEEACRHFGRAITWEKLSDTQLIDRAARALFENRLIGWAQGRMECGPRALGNRSILGNPTDPKVKDALNLRVKKRESFRPYAPSILKEECANWFDIDESPYMLLDAMVHPHQRHKVPGIVHIDGSSRPQTVTELQNPRYYRLIRAFFNLSGVPLILNTSFNRHTEPIVNRPQEAILVLLRTELDELFIGNYHVCRATVGQ